MELQGNLSRWPRVHVTQSLKYYCTGSLINTYSGGCWHSPNVINAKRLSIIDNNLVLITYSKDKTPQWETRSLVQYSMHFPFIQGIHTLMGRRHCIRLYIVIVYEMVFWNHANISLHDFFSLIVRTIVSMVTVEFW